MTKPNYSSRYKQSRSRSNSKSNSENDCQKGSIYRKPYTRKFGSKMVRVKGNCIRATSESGKKRTVIDQKYLKQKARSQARARVLTRSKSKKCPKGQIARTAFKRKGHNRSSYTRSNGSKVRGSIVRPSLTSSVCINKRGKSTRGKPLFHLESNVLGKYGYKNVKHMPSNERHRALDRALNDGRNPLSLFRRINALYVLNKNQDPKFATILQDDKDYIRTTNAYQNRSTRNSNTSSGSFDSKNESSLRSRSRSRLSSRSTSSSRSRANKRSNSRSSPNKKSNSRSRSNIRSNSRSRPNKKSRSRSRSRFRSSSRSRQKSRSR